LHTNILKGQIFSFTIKTISFIFVCKPMNDFTFSNSLLAAQQKKALKTKALKNLEPKNSTLHFLRCFARTYHFEPQLPVSLQQMILG